MQKKIQNNICNKIECYEITQNELQNNLMQNLESRYLL